MYALVAEAVTKRFGRVVALNNFSLRVEEGEVLCLLGPNGAGKTTFLNIVSTVLRPTSGSVRVFGRDVVREGHVVRSMVGYAFQEPRLFWRFSPREILTFHAKVYGVRDLGVVDEVLKALDLWGVRDRSVEYLSGGQRKKVEVGKVFVQRPRLALLDEPTAMIDLEGKHVVWDMIRALRDEGSTVIVATNEIYEAEYLATKVVIMDRGEVVAEGDPEGLKERLGGGDIIDVYLEGARAGVVEAIRVVEGVIGIDVVGDRVSVRARRYEDVLPEIVEVLKRCGVRARSIRVAEPTLDDIFLRATRGAGR